MSKTELTKEERDVARAELYRWTKEKVAQSEIVKAIELATGMPFKQQTISQAINLGKLGMGLAQRVATARGFGTVKAMVDAARQRGDVQALLGELVVRRGGVVAPAPPIFSSLDTFITVGKRQGLLPEVLTILAEEQHAEDPGPRYWAKRYREVLEVQNEMAGLADLSFVANAGPSAGSPAAADLDVDDPNTVPGNVTLPMLPPPAPVEDEETQPDKTGERAALRGIADPNTALLPKRGRDSVLYLHAMGRALGLPERLCAGVEAQDAAGLYTDRELARALVDLAKPKAQLPTMNDRQEGIFSRLKKIAPFRGVFVSNDEALEHALTYAALKAENDDEAFWARFLASRKVPAPPPDGEEYDVKRKAQTKPKRRAPTP